MYFFFNEGEFKYAWREMCRHNLSVWNNVQYKYMEIMGHWKDIYDLFAQTA